MRIAQKIIFYPFLKRFTITWITLWFTYIQYTVGSHIHHMIQKDFRSLSEFEHDGLIA
jgi:hypothetical protein